MKRLINIIVLLLLLPCLALAEDAAVIVGQVRYPLALAKYACQSNFDLLAAQGKTLTAEEKDQVILDTLDHLVDLALIENKLIEAGQNSVSPEEEAILRSYAGNLYESIWQGFQRQVEQAGYSATEAQITTWMEQQGYTLDMVYQEALINLRYSRIYQLYCQDVTVTPEEVETFLQENYVQPDREAYENDIERYETEILATGNEAFFVPAGYRIIRQILLPFPQEVVTELNALTPRIEAASQELDTAYRAIADAVIAGGDGAQERESYQEKEAAFTGLMAQAEAIQEKALPLLKETTDEIQRRFENGADFGYLIDTYAQEAGKNAGAELLFHQDSKQWAEAFRSRVMKLEKPGSITEPFVTSLGVHIVYYQGDLPGGVQELNQEERAALEAAALESKMNERLQSECLNRWRREYLIETHPEYLFPDE